MKSTCQVRFSRNCEIVPFHCCFGWFARLGTVPVSLILKVLQCHCNSPVVAACAISVDAFGSLNTACFLILEHNTGDGS